MHSRGQNARLLRLMSRAILTLAEGKVFDTLDPDTQGSILRAQRLIADLPAPRTDDTPFDPVNGAAETAREMITQSMYHPGLAAWAATHEDATPYGWSKDLPTYDFNREMFAPGEHPDFPDGVIGIRTDDDFWIVAMLPWEFHDIQLQAVISTLWPDVAAREDFAIGYDRGPSANIDMQGHMQRVSEYAQHAQSALESLSDATDDLRAMAAAAGDPFNYFKPRKADHD